jgi:hypothetical protein
MVGDLDADGYQDLICVNVSSYTVGVLRGKGDGTFHAHIGYLSGAGPYVDALGDLDGDGRLDIAAANTGSNSVTVLLQGTGAAPSTVVDLATSAVGDRSARLTWTTPAVESAGPLTSYDLRSSTGIMVPGTFAGATAVTPAPAIARSGLAVSHVLAGLAPNTTYSVALTTTDAHGRTSALSNIHTFTTAANDALAPNQITLNAYTIGDHYVVLRWTAPGDDLNMGTAAAYDLRMGTTPINDDPSFAAAIAVPTATPQPAGSLEQVLITGLAENTTYHLAITASDEVPLTGTRSTTLSFTTDLGDTIAPAGITDLAVTATTSTSLTLAWTARGDDGNLGPATAYDLRWSSAPITDVTTFLAATPVAGLPAPGLPGTTEQMVVTGLAPGTVHHFALRVNDETPNTSALSNAVSGSTDAAGGGGSSAGSSGGGSCGVGAGLATLVLMGGMLLLMRSRRE